MTFAPNFLWSSVDPKGRFSSQKVWRSGAQIQEIDPWGGFLVNRGS
jgi:hypothetical protein